MAYRSLQAIVLAAGKSKRFKTGRTKLIEPICGRPMVVYTTKLLEDLKIPTLLVVGYQSEAVKECVEQHHRNSIEFIEQKEQLGTGHAILSAKDKLTLENILILNGDMPLITEGIISSLCRKHTEKKATISFVTAHNSDPSAQEYGRVIREDDAIKIVEAKEFTGDTREYCSINAGIYVVRRDFLVQKLDEIQQNNKANEFYFTDMVQIASNLGLNIQTMSVPFDLVRGTNTLKELWAAEQIKRSELISHWMQNGVKFSMAQTVHVDVDVTIERGSYIGAGVRLANKTTIGQNCKILPFTILNDTTIGEGTTIDASSLVRSSTIGKNCQIGPFASIHDGARLGDNVVVDPFVDLNGTDVGKDTTIRALSHLGNAKIGSGTEIGSGSITSGHPGKNRKQIVIEAGSYIAPATLIKPQEQMPLKNKQKSDTSETPTTANFIGSVKLHKDEIQET